jgi:hypothetical protein
MQQHHKSHLVSTHTTVLQHLSEIRQVAAGKSPGGGRLVPLPRPEREQLAVSLDAIAVRFEQVMKRFVGDWQRVAGDAQDLAATRMWVNILLRTVEELVADLHPTRMQKRYGEMKAEAASRLQQDVETLLSLVRAMVDV